MDPRSVEPFPPTWTDDGPPAHDRFPALPRSIAWEPDVDEPTLWRALEWGDLECWRRLVQILREQDRLAELEPSRERLAATASEKELTRLVDLCSSSFDAVSGARFQVARVTRFPADAVGMERCAALLAEVGSFDEAVAAQREALRLGNGATYFRLWPERTLRALTRGGRFDDAEELLRAYPGEMAAVFALALLLQVRGRTAEGEELLRRHPAADHFRVRYALFTLLERDGRHAEAAEVVPAEGWPLQMRREAERRAVESSPFTLPRVPPDDHPHWAIWSVDDFLGRAFAV
ncbi:hypothetical protein AB0G04_25025 [Actinoplanes sp. NPDC023801]|uniref:hypothetical protein n=1 Tax=Actinoplanes sp. NPDC023801 TaxID=3154595 RepID=UPI0033EC6676